MLLSLVRASPELEQNCARISAASDDDNMITTMATMTMLMRRMSHDQVIRNKDGKTAPTTAQNVNVLATSGFGELSELPTRKRHRTRSKRFLRVRSLKKNVRKQLPTSDIPAWAREERQRDRETARKWCATNLGHCFTNCSSSLRCKFSNCTNLQLKSTCKLRKKRKRRCVLRVTHCVSDQTK